jgi:predicted Zn-dependent peptidase
MTLPGLQIPVESRTLKNGLRVVVSQDHTAPLVTVGVYYKIGFRLEPQGRSGFAHLFEHMMFQGSEHAGKMEHIKLINSSGGVLNGTTSYDVTNYFEAVPSNALERVLWLESDRMRALKVDDENLRNQRDVVKEEVRVNVLNQPYGGFPWLDLPPVAFRNWANAHNFYGDFADLDAATLADVREFFKTYYVPSNAVLVIVGDVEPEEAFDLAQRYFEDIADGAQPTTADVTEPPQTDERRGIVEEKFGTLPAVAIGYRAPARHTQDWYAAALLDYVLHSGRSGRFYRALVQEQQLAVEVSGDTGDLIELNGPSQIVTHIFYKPEVTDDQILAAYDAIVEDVRKNGIADAELEQIKVKFRSDFVSTLESGRGGFPRFGLLHYLACFTLFDDDPGWVNRILEKYMSVTAEQVRSVAEKYFVPGQRAMVFRLPAGRPSGRKAA